MRYCSALATAALLFAQSAIAFDTPIFNFEQQANQYTNQLDSAPTSMIDKDIYQHDTKTNRANQSRKIDLPNYLTAKPEKDWDYLLGQTYTIFGLSVATVGLMTFLPESITNWNSEARNFNNLTKKWWENVSDGPIWDKDDHYLNYVMHPYFGGVYYTAARHSGFDQFESFLYSFTMSTFFWEYGVESFAEIPSIQDVIVTPLFGAAVGEWMYIAEQRIVANDQEVLNSEILGSVSLFFLNPVGHIHHWATSLWQDETEVALNYDPWFNNKEAATFAQNSQEKWNDKFVSMVIRFKF